MIERIRFRAFDMSTTYDAAHSAILPGPPRWLTPFTSSHSP